MRERFSTSFMRVSVATITALLVFTSVQEAKAQSCVPPPSGLVSWWPGDGNANDIADGNDGTLQNGATFATGEVGQAFSCDGVDDFVFVPDAPNLNFGPTSSPLTIEAWIFRQSAAGTQHLLGKRQGCGGDFDFYQLAIGGNPYLPPSQVPLNEWTHVAVSQEGGVLNLYVNGALVATNFFPLGSTTAPLEICNSGTCSPFGGLIDEVSIYNRVLSQEEIAAIANAGSAGKCKELTIATRSVPPIKLENPTSYQLKAQLGTPPYAWSLSGGTLPPGINLSTEGLLSGTPTEPGSFSFTITVTDDHGDTAEKAFTQDVVLILPPPSIHIHKTGTRTVPGREIDYFILVENTGTTEATDVVIEEHLISPDFKTDVFNFVSGVPEPDFVEDGFVLIWVLPSLMPGENQLLTYRVRLNASLALGTPVVGGACHADDDVPLSAMQSRMTTVGENCKLAVQICKQAYCDSLDGCISDCKRAFPGPILYPARRVCISGCFITFGQCAGCMKGAVDICRNECSVSSTCQPCPDGCGCDEQDTTGPVDPNEKLVVAKKCSRDPDDGTITCFIQPDQLLVYPVHFENISDDVEALDVFVTDVLDSNLDISTLNILTPNGASFDVTTRTLKWSLLGRNLQPHETDNVLLSIRPKPDLPSGTEIRNKATIQFEIFETLDTNEVVNVIDSTKPMCMMNPLPAQTSTLEFPISWSGTDAVGEIETYAVLVSVDGGNFTPLLEKTSYTGTTFTGELGKTYAFLCVAVDTAGNIEVQDPVAEATTTLIPPADLTLKRGTLFLDPDSDEDKLTFQGTFAGSAASINPPTEGVKITLTDADGQIVTLDFPAGALWKTNRGPRWAFKDPIAGKTLTLQFSAKTGTFSLRVNVRKVNLNDADPGAITTSVLIGDNLFQNVREWRSTAKGTKLVTP